MSVAGRQIINVENRPHRGGEPRKTYYVTTLVLDNGDLIYLYDYNVVDKSYKEIEL